MSTEHDEPYFDFYVFLFFYDNVNVKENVFFQSASWKRHCATYWRERRGWDLVIFDWFAPSMRMQVILDSSFARPGWAPIWDGKKAEFRDWTSFVRARADMRANDAKIVPSRDAQCNTRESP